MFFQALYSPRVSVPFDALGARLLLLLLCCSVTAIAFAQPTPTEKADKALEYGDVANAALYYDTAIKELPTTTDAANKEQRNQTALLFLKAARCQALLYKYPAADALCDKALKLATNSKTDTAGVYDAAMLLKGQMLQRVGKYDAALPYFQAYAQSHADAGQAYIDACRYAQTATPSAYKVAAAPFNTAASDFAATFWATNDANATTTKVVYSSLAGATASRLWLTEFYPTDTKDNKAGWTKPRLEKSALNAQEGEGFAAFTATGLRAVFVKTNARNGVALLPNSPAAKQDLFFGSLKSQGVWKDPATAFALNGTSYSVGFPFLTPKGETLFFASDMSGGFGGFDLYYCTFSSVTGKWTDPVNLGAQVNTAGNEISPFVENGVLYFASDRLPGLGGFDVFRANIAGNEVVTIPENMGKGINSSADDFCFTYNAAREMGFVTSNRAGGKGFEDIYTVQALAPPTPTKSDASPLTAATTPEGSIKPAVAAHNSASPTPKSEATKPALTTDTPPTPTHNGIQGLVTDANGKPIEGLVIICKGAGANDAITKTDATGHYTLPLVPNSVYSVEYSKAGYVIATKTVKTNTIMGDEVLGTQKVFAASTNLGVVSAVKPQTYAAQQGKPVQTDKRVYEILCKVANRPATADNAATLLKRLHTFGEVAVKKSSPDSAYFQLSLYESETCARATSQQIVKQTAFASAEIQILSRLVTNSEKDKIALRMTNDLCLKATTTPPVQKTATAATATPNLAPKLATTTPVDTAKPKPNPKAAVAATTSTKPATTPAPEGLKYYVQLACYTYTKHISTPEITLVDSLKLGTIVEKSYDGKQYALLGEFNTHGSAYAVREAINAQIPNIQTFVVAFDAEGHRINLNKNISN